MNSSFEVTGTLLALTLYRLDALLQVSNSACLGDQSKTPSEGLVFFNQIVCAMNLQIKAIIAEIEDCPYIVRDDKPAKPDGSVH